MEAEKQSRRWHCGRELFPDNGEPLLDANMNIPDERHGVDEWLDLRQRREEALHSPKRPPFEHWQWVRERIENLVMEPLEKLAARLDAETDLRESISRQDAALLVECTARAFETVECFRRGVVSPFIAVFDAFQDAMLDLPALIAPEMRDDTNRFTSFTELVRDLREELNKFDAGVKQWEKNLAERGL